MEGKQNKPAEPIEIQELKDEPKIIDKAKLIEELKEMTDASNRNNFDNSKYEEICKTLFDNAENIDDLESLSKYTYKVYGIAAGPCYISEYDKAVKQKMGEIYLEMSDGISSEKEAIDFLKRVDHNYATFLSAKINCFRKWLDVCSTAKDVKKVFKQMREDRKIDANKVIFEWLNK